MSSLAWRLSVLVACGAISGLSWAGEDLEAKKQAAALIDEGNRRMSLEQFDTALARYQEAFAKYKSPKIFLNMAEAELALGHPVEALGLYVRFQREAPAELRTKLESSINERVAELKRQVGFLALSGSEGTVIRVDGTERGVLPLEPLAVTAGAHRVEAQRPGEAAQGLQIEVAAGQSLPLRIAAPDITPPIAEAPAIVAPISPVEASPGLTDRWWFWTLLGVGVAAAATGVAIGVSAGGNSFVPQGELGSTNTADWRRF
ncbi:MAG: hypothetical protein U1E65_15995 [Myxococcota bacterium]